MVGLSVILENYKDLSAKKTRQVIESMIKPPSFPNPSSPSSSSPGYLCTKSTISTLASNSGFLGSCSLCKKQLLPGKDIYMYKGDRAFCSVECRGRQMLMDEQE